MKSFRELAEECRRVVATQYRLDPERQLRIDGSAEPLADAVFARPDFEEAQDQHEPWKRGRGARPGVPSPGELWSPDQGELFPVPLHQRRDELRAITAKDLEALNVDGFAARHRAELEQLARLHAPELKGSPASFAIGMLTAVFAGLSGGREFKTTGRTGTPIQIDADDWAQLLGVHRSTVFRAWARLDPTHAASERMHRVRCGRKGRGFRERIDVASKLRPGELGRRRFVRHRRSSRRLSKLTGGRLQGWTCGKCKRCLSGRAHTFVDLVPVTAAVGRTHELFLQPGPALLELLHALEPHYLRLRRRLALATAPEKVATPSLRNPSIPTYKGTSEAVEHGGFIGPDPPHTADGEPASVWQGSEGNGKQPARLKPCERCLLLFHDGKLERERVRLIPRRRGYFWCVPCLKLITRWGKSVESMSRTRQGTGRPRVASGRR